MSSVGEREAEALGCALGSNLFRARFHRGDSPHLAILAQAHLPQSGDRAPPAPRFAAHAAAAKAGMPVSAWRYAPRDQAVRAVLQALTDDGAPALASPLSTARDAGLSTRRCLERRVYLARQQRAIRQRHLANGSSRDGPARGSRSVRTFVRPSGQTLHRVYLGLMAASAAQIAEDSFAELLGPGRGGGSARTPALARFSIHPTIGFYLEHSDDAAQRLSEFSARVAAQAALLSACAQAGWRTSRRSLAHGQDPWIEVSKRFFNLTAALTELLALGAGDAVLLDYFPSGDIAERDGCLAVRFTDIGEAHVYCQRKRIATVGRDGALRG